MGDLQAVVEECGALTNMTTITIFSGVATGIMMLFTIPLNAFVIYLLIKERKLEHLYYKLLLNIAISDLLTGLVTDPLGIRYLLHEAIDKEVPTSAEILAHMSLFFINSVALISLTLLSVDRILALAYPRKHFKGMVNSIQLILVTSTWPLASLLVLPYFKLNFIKHLLVFLMAIMMLAVFSLLLTTLIYRIKLGSPIGSPSLPISESTFLLAITPKILRRKSMESSVGNSNSKNQLAPKIHQHQRNVMKKSTRAFLFMLYSLLATYLPASVTSIYMNACSGCPCETVHIMRDISILSILLSSVVRPINFIMILKHLKRRASVILFKKKENKDGMIELESLSSYRRHRKNTI